VLVEALADRAQAEGDVVGHVRAPTAPKKIVQLQLLEPPSGM
jgi:hypothetical protein